MYNNPVTKAALLASAAALGPKATSTQIVNNAGFNSPNSRRMISAYFGPRKQMFEEIVIILKTPRERLIEAAKRLPPAASEHEIVSAAGYRSTRIIHFYFRSIEELKRRVGHYECNKERITYPNVEFSPQDISKGVTIPEEMNELVAEEMGLHAGDGCLKRIDGKPDYSYSIVGDKVEEKEFLDVHVKSLFKRIYNLDVRPRLLAGGKGYGVHFSSKAIYTYKHTVIGFKTGYKTNSVEVPNQIIHSSDSIKAAFIRGLADADFCYAFGKKHKDRHYYPTVIGSFASGSLVEQLNILLEELGLSPGTSARKRSDRAVSPEYTVWVKGKNQLERWMELVGSNNPKHKTKVEIWKKFGFCPPHTRLAQRKAILSGTLDPNSFYQKVSGNA